MVFLQRAILRVDHVVPTHLVLDLEFLERQRVGEPVHRCSFRAESRFSTIRRSAVFRIARQSRVSSSRSFRILRTHCHRRCPKSPLRRAIIYRKKLLIATRPRTATPLPSGDAEYYGFFSTRAELVDLTESRGWGRKEGKAHPVSDGRSRLNKPKLYIYIYTYLQTQPL